MSKKPARKKPSQSRITVGASRSGSVYYPPGESPSELKVRLTEALNGLKIYRERCDSMSPDGLEHRDQRIRELEARIRSFEHEIQLRNQASFQNGERFEAYKRERELAERDIRERERVLLRVLDAISGGVLEGQAGLRGKRDD